MPSTGSKSSSLFRPKLAEDARILKKLTELACTAKNCFIMLPKFKRKKKKEGNVGGDSYNKMAKY